MAAHAVVRLHNDDGTPVIAIGDGFGVDRAPRHRQHRRRRGRRHRPARARDLRAITTKSLDFTSDDGSVISLHNGDSGLLVVEGVDVVATNIWSADHSTN